MTIADPLIVESAERLFASLAQEGDFAKAWTKVEASGFLDILAERSGELPASNAFAVARVSGQFAIALPIVETMIVRAALPGAVRKDLVGALTLAQAGPSDAVLAAVPWARNAHAVLFEDGSGSALVRKGAFCVDEGIAYGGDPRDTIRFEASGVERLQEPHALHLLGTAAAMRVAQMSGAIDALLAMTVRYAADRHQFGRPIGSFQSVQHIIATLASDAEAASTAATLAVRGFDAGNISVIAAAKARAGDAAAAAAKKAHQVHGAIGLTAEHSLHRFSTRLLTWSQEFGTTAFWRRELGRMVVQRGGVRLWPWVASGGATS